MRLLGLQSAAISTVLLLAASAHAGFGGQPILGPLSAGSSVPTANTTGHADDNDGFTSGDHFFDVWDGPDDAYRLDWPGGTMTLTLTYDNSAAELDFFLFEPGSYDDSSNYAIDGASVSQIVAVAAPAGLYYINIDSAAGDEGAYSLSVSAVPEPATLALASLLVPAVSRRRRA